MAGWILGTVFVPGRRLCLEWEERAMRMSSSIVAPSAVAVLSTALLCGLSGMAMSQTQLPGVTIDAPKQVARPHRRVARPHRPPHVANTFASNPASPTAQKPAPGSVLAALEKIASRANSSSASFKSDNRPRLGCSSPGGFTLAITCRNPYNFKTYQECGEAGILMGWRHYEIWWYCSSLHASGVLSGEKQPQFAELKRRR
jgi:hypothetical protein